MKHLKKRYWLVQDHEYESNVGLDSVDFGSDDLNEILGIIKSLRESRSYIIYQGEWIFLKDIMEVFDSVEKEYIKID